MDKASCFWGVSAFISEPTDCAADMPFTFGSLTLGTTTSGTDIMYAAWSADSKSHVKTSDTDSERRMGGWWIRWYRKIRIGGAETGNSKSLKRVRGRCR